MPVPLRNQQPALSRKYSDILQIGCVTADSDMEKGSQLTGFVLGYF